MEILILIIVALVFLVVGGIITHLIYYRDDTKNDNEKNFTNSDYSSEKLQLFSDEWRITIETQMHFNDLIIRFRSIVLSVFLAGVAIVFGLDFKIELNNFDFFILMLFAIVFWICCFLLDLFYYNRLLQGAVDHARKFDNETYFKRNGFFGLTSSIIKRVSPLWSQILILIFYLLPLVVLVVSLVLKTNSNFGK